VSTAPSTINALTELALVPEPPLTALEAAARPLTELPLRADARIVALVPPDEAHDPAHEADIVARLGELGFLPGERVRILARGLFGDPLAVRVGTGTFALRGGEARCIHVRFEDEPPRP
jgi:ferrous iron transport protein A